MSQPQTPQQPSASTDPANSFIQAMLVIALLACIGTIALVVIELNQHYGVTFGGMLEAPQQSSSSTAPGK